MGKAKTSGGIEARELRAFIERIERLEEEKKELADDIRSVYAEAKGTGFDVKIMRKIVALRKQDENKRREEEELLDVYMTALGMQHTLPFDGVARQAVKAFGTPVEPTDEEKSEGVVAAFNKDGTRMSIGMPRTA